MGTPPSDQPVTASCTAACIPRRSGIQRQSGRLYRRYDKRDFSVQCRATRFRLFDLCCRPLFRGDRDLAGRRSVVFRPTRRCVVRRADGYLVLARHH